jgi:hypothetical protein
MRAAASGRLAAAKGVLRDATGDSGARAEELGAFGSVVDVLGATGFPERVATAIATMAAAAVDRTTIWARDIRYPRVHGTWATSNPARTRDELGTAYEEILFVDRMLGTMPYATVHTGDIVQEGSSCICRRLHRPKHSTSHLRAGSPMNRKSPRVFR